MCKKKLLLGTALALLWGTVAQAAIISVIETNLVSTPAIIASGFGEDSLTFSDRTHQHNGAAFDTATGLLSTTGTNIVPLPSYLLGGDFVQFANDARDDAGYSATVFADERSTWYLLVDNRVNGPAADNSSPNNSDPVLGGTLNWVPNGNWERVNTGISPNGQPDYTAVDEDGDGVGPGVGLNQFYSVYKFPLDIDVVTVRNNGVGGNNMVALIAVPEPTGIVLLFSSLIGLVFRRRR
jgi:hypothetical protein